MTAPRLHSLIPEWVDRAACAGLDVEIFFPAHRDRAGRTRAQEICAQCPVIWQCLADAMRAEHGASENARHGVRGGLPANRRYALSKAVPAETFAEAVIA